jgi:hypothetical protein
MHTPLVFVRPVGFSAADSLRLLKAAQLMDGPVRWRLAPSGVMADIYLAHADSIQKSTRLRASGDSASGNSQTSGFEYSHLSVDDNGYHKNHPVCVLGQRSHDDASATMLPALVFPQALQELQEGLRKVQEELISQRMLYALGATAWEERRVWKTHRLHLQHQSRLVATIVPQNWEVHLSTDCTVEELDQAVVQTVPQSTGFAALGFDVLPLEHALWEFAKRCPEALLAQMVPTVYLTQPLTHRRIAQMSERALGDHCAAVLQLLDLGSRSADDIQKQLRLTRPALLRTLACLALIRAIQPQRQLSGMWSWLPRFLRRRVFGPSGMF